MRFPYRTEESEHRLHQYITGILAKLESPVIKITSMPDRMHILFLLSKNYALAKVVEEVKKSLSIWMKNQRGEGFTWQIGYSAFSVSASKAQNKIKLLFAT